MILSRYYTKGQGCVRIIAALILRVMEFQNKILKSLKRSSTHQGIDTTGIERNVAPRLSHHSMFDILDPSWEKRELLYLFSNALCHASCQNKIWWHMAMRLVLTDLYPPPQKKLDLPCKNDHAYVFLKRTLAFTLLAFLLYILSLLLFLYFLSIHFT